MSAAHYASPSYSGASCPPDFPRCEHCGGEASPETGVCVDECTTGGIAHPDYPTGDGPGGDRCVCGGIRHWHGAAQGCDDCPCPAFVEVT